jgi:MoaA/NifB/PqqE/SkfB family radical SAM enzyme
MPIAIHALHKRRLEKLFRNRAPGLFARLATLGKYLKDRRYFYLRQGREFASLADDFPVPYVVDIETFNKCNSTCAFCPVNRFADPRETMRMSEELFTKIVEDLRAIGFNGILHLFSNNEPFLDKRIFHFAEVARNRLPHAIIEIYTNGTALNIEKTESILKHLTHLYINNYAKTPTLHRNIQDIVDHIDNHRPDLATKISVNLRGLDEFISTRAGNAPNRAKARFAYKSRCAYPFFEMVVRPDGKLSLCCNDALGQETLGDLSVQSVCEAWNDPRRKEVQALMLQGRHKLDICRGCDNFYVAKPDRVRKRDFSD